MTNFIPDRELSTDEFGPSIYPSSTCELLFLLWMFCHLSLFFSLVVCFRTSAFLIFLFCASFMLKDAVSKTPLSFSHKCLPHRYLLHTPLRTSRWFITSLATLARQCHQLSGRMQRLVALLGAFRSNAFSLEDVLDLCIGV